MSRSYSVTRAQVVIHTFAKGLLAALAHDLALSATPIRATAGPLPNGTWSAILEVPVDEVRVVGVVKKGKTLTDVLSAKDKSEIESRMRGDVFKGATAIFVEAAGTPDAAGNVQGAKVELQIGVDGPRATAKAEIRLTQRGEEIGVAAAGTLSLRALGVGEIKGPLGAFSLKDEVRFEAALVMR